MTLGPGICSLGGKPGSAKSPLGKVGVGHGWEARVSQVELLGDDGAWEPTQWKLLLCGKNISQLAFAPPSLSHCSQKKNYYKMLPFLVLSNTITSLEHAIESKRRQDNICIQTPVILLPPL